MPTTSGGLPYPADTAAADIPADMQALAEAVDTVNTSDFKAANPFKRDIHRFTVSPDTSVITWDYTPSGTYRTYIGGSPEPADWPADMGFSTEVFTDASYQADPQAFGIRPVRFMTDADEIVFYAAPINAGDAFHVFVDGQLATQDPTAMPTTGFKFGGIVFSAKRTRLIEIYTDVGIHSLYCKKPHKLWKPPPYTGTKIAAVGDSYVAGAVQSDTLAEWVPIPEYGIYQSLAPLVGVEQILIDGVGGTGYIQESVATNDNYYQRRADIYAHNPDVLIRHGGGVNDLYNGSSVSAIVAQAVTLFTADRAALPNAKLVFMEGFAPPGFGGFNDEYTDIRTQLQAALTSVGVYYVDVATTAPWINGLGYVTAPNVDGENSSTYVGYDSIHLTVAGNAYVRGRLAPIMGRILRDRGTLLNTLISR